MDKLVETARKLLRNVVEGRVDLMARGDDIRELKEALDDYDRNRQ